MKPTLSQLPRNSILDMSGANTLFSDSLCYLQADMIEWAMDPHNRDILEQVAEGLWTRIHRAYTPQYFAQCIRRWYDEAHLDECDSGVSAMRSISGSGAQDTLHAPVPSEVEREVVSV